MDLQPILAELARLAVDLNYPETNRPRSLLGAGDGVLLVDPR